MFSSIISQHSIMTVHQVREKR